MRHLGASSGTALLVLTSLLGAGCGTRVEQGTASSQRAADRSRATAAPPSSGAAVGAASDPNPNPGTPSPVGPSSGSQVGQKEAAGGSSRRGGPTNASSGNPGSVEAAGAKAGVPTGREAAPTQPEKAQRGEGSSGIPGPAPGGLGSSSPGPRSPALFASVSYLSGPGSDTTAPMIQATQVWVKHINQKGGLNGHELRVFVYDDAGDPARHRAQVREAVEQRHVIGFLTQINEVAGEDVAYITEKRIPVVGGGTVSSTFYASPMFFPQGSFGAALNRAAIGGAAQYLVPQGKTKLATLVCVEVQACPDADRVFAESAKSFGFEHVYRTKASLAQPDFTAQCLNARSAGAQVFLVYLSQDGLRRLAASCARQDYRPTFSIPTAGALDAMKNDPNFEGLVTPSPVFPYFQTGTPATDEFHQALRTYGPDLVLSNSLSIGWTAGKLLERAGRNLPEPPTSEALLEGLWSLKDDTLGGLTYPLTFVKDQPTRETTCWFTAVTQKGEWVSPDRFTLRCAPS